MSGENLVIGDTWDFDVEVTDNGVAVDISGATLTCKGMADVNDVAPAFTVSTTLGTNVNTQAGKGRVTVPAATTAPLTEKDYEISVKITLVSGAKYTLYKETHRAEKV